MDYKWILLALAIIVVLIVVYKKRNTILGWFGKKPNAVIESLDHKKYDDGPPSPPEESQVSQEYVVLTIASSPEEGKEIILGDLYIKLYEDLCPRTCHNFKSLSKIEYKGCVIHRLIPGFMFQSGDFQNSDGTGGSSVFDTKNFPDENLTLKHNKKGLLSMANSGPNTNGSQFFITFAPCQHLDGKHVIFGEVVSGWDVLDVIENQPTKSNDEPVQLLYIQNTSFTNRL
jgi:cyclophilin family peptidyl-prolyl cis-trans isomerase